jgi:NADPH:quinone reductase-like Zn-dependent oxidoreductase
MFVDRLLDDAVEHVKAAGKDHALQIARAMGVKVLDTAGTPRGLELAKREGAHQVFDHRKPGYQERATAA